MYVDATRTLVRAPSSRGDPWHVSGDTLPTPDPEAHTPGTSAGETRLMEDLRLVITALLVLAFVVSFIPHG